MAILPAALAGFPLAAQRLSLDEAIRTALQNNLQVTIAQQVREEARSEARSREGAFDWNLGADLQASRLKTFSLPPVPGTEVSQTTVTHGRSLTGSLNKLFPWGGTLAFQYAPSYNHARTFWPGGVDGNGNPVAGYGFATPGPYGGSVNAGYTQSLLRGLGPASTTASLVVARKQARAADHRFRLAVIQLVADTETRYWDVVFAVRALANKRLALELARQQLQQNTLQVQAGTMAALEVAAAEAQVAKAEQDIIAAEARNSNARDTLLRTLHPGGGGTDILEPSDNPISSCRRMEEAAAIQGALQRRAELQAARIEREVAQVKERAAADRVRPKLDAFVEYRGASNSYDSLGPVNSDLAGLSNPGYTVGLSFAVPLQNREARGRHAAARAQLSAQGLRLRDQELSVALEVRRALRDVEAAEKGVQASGKTRHYQEKSLEAERARFQHGLSTNFTVLKVMTDLDQARSDELKAQIEYAKAVTAMEVALGTLLEARNLTVK
ncbi:MAG: TolC family protein [Holophaga sp.]|nr:TolC family protein [Holophaga sp.]